MQKIEPKDSFQQKLMFEQVQASNEYYWYVPAADTAQDDTLNLCKQN